MVDKKWKFFCAFLLVQMWTLGQDSLHFHSKAQHFTLRFELINNLMVIPAKLNDSTHLNFVLDSGSPYTLITDFSLLKELTVKKGKVITLGGLGHGYEIQAYDSRFNKLKVGKAVKHNTHLILLIDSPLTLSKFLGYPVHGITGFDVFKDFVVEINYRKEKIHFYQHDYFYRKKKRKLKKFTKIPIEFHQRKPYLKADIYTEKDTAIHANMLIDSGGWDAVWWFEDSEPKLDLPQRNFQDTLGHGINGSITGYRSKSKRVLIQDFEFERPTTSFPDSLSLSRAISFPKRNGSIGGEILRRFHVIMDYKNQYIYLRPNANYNQAFHYDMSGIKLQKPFEDLPYLEVVAIRENSPADMAGIQLGDLITKVNGENIEDNYLSKMMDLFRSKPGKKITVTLMRNGYRLVKSFRLKDPL